MPIRLWSVVVSQLEKRPRESCTCAGTVSTLTAIRGLHLEPLLQVVDRRVQLLLTPVVADGRHRVAALSEEEGERVAVGEQRALRDRRADQPLAVHPVTLGTDAGEGVVADVVGRARP